MADLDAIREAVRAWRDGLPAHDAMVVVAMAAGATPPADDDLDAHGYLRGEPRASNRITVQPASERLTWKLRGAIGRAYLRLQCADVPRGPWHDEVSGNLLAVADEPRATVQPAARLSPDQLAERHRETLIALAEDRRTDQTGEQHGPG